METRDEGSTVRAGQRTLQVKGRRNYLDTNRGERPSDGKLGTFGRSRRARFAWPASLLDRGRERERRRLISLGRCGGDLEKNNGRPAHQRLLVHERNFCGSKESRRGLCPGGEFLSLHRWRKEFCGDQGGAGRRRLSHDVDRS